MVFFNKIRTADLRGINIYSRSTFVPENLADNTKNLHQIRLLFAFFKFRAKPVGYLQWRS